MPPILRAAALLLPCQLPARASSSTRVSCPHSAPGLMLLRRGACALMPRGKSLLWRVVVVMVTRATKGRNAEARTVHQVRMAAQRGDASRAACKEEPKEASYE